MSSFLLPFVRVVTTPFGSAFDTAFGSTLNQVLFTPQYVEEPVPIVSRQFVSHPGPQITTPDWANVRTIHIKTDDIDIWAPLKEEQRRRLMTGQAGLEVIYGELFEEATRAKRLEPQQNQRETANTAPVVVESTREYAERLENEVAELKRQLTASKVPDFGSFNDEVARAQEASSVRVKAATPADESTTEEPVAEAVKSTPKTRKTISTQTAAEDENKFRVTWFASSYTYQP
eukprot:Gregarina_sp_Poly_1__2582@NODE_16_length_22882_cov_82_653956_g14_i0_p9_GENE_NODE_16_length_22882_cov_82_653956_g14_i0NODE_16_length_22882_cov_82_653956_g14_i0_p9_ORF_typecomplete_len232_score45_03PilO/PF04350_13/0_05US2/PF02476_15/0_31US2/PF02476_15/1_2e03_NODE_16_length_22882_cov_82_653956_g14_i01388814583